jgi:serine/threonine-protein kinase RsbT
METSNLNQLVFAIKDEIDIAYAALGTRKYAQEIGFNVSAQFMISTAVSELARNIFVYAKEGKIVLSVQQKNCIKGLRIIAKDSGRGIEDIEKALSNEFSTGGTMGVGLPGTKRLMDEFKIITTKDEGTMITVVKWIR